LIPVLVLSAFMSLSAQEVVPDSADTIYASLDSLNTGLDLALSALKMKRGDLAFRGDYLEPDIYRLEEIDDFMLSPLKLLDSVERILHEPRQFLPLSLYGVGSQDSIEAGGLKKMAEKAKQMRNADTLFNSENRQKLDVELTRFFDQLIEFANIRNRFMAEILSDGFHAEKDSIIEGFTLLLEENVEDEFLSVNEIDSLSRYEDEWAMRLVQVAADYAVMGKTVGRLVGDLKYPIPVDLGQQVPVNQSAYGFSMETDYGRIMIGDTTDNHYSGDLFIVIDPGGDDIYDIRLDGTGHHTYIIDYAGNDTYNMPKNRISPYFFGSHMIIDYEGDDFYNGGSWTLGTGLFGVGILWDMKGNDRYFGDTFTQGAGCFGVGILRDDEGNDSYQAALFAQGFGFVDGVGVLMDNSGNDNYFAGGKYKDILRYDDHYLSLSQGFAYGIRPKMSGGVGMLIDKSGNDVYVSDIFGQGASYWYGLGVLADGGGNDQYISFQYAQGNGTHMSLGILYDVAGDDVYSAKGVSQGCGHDRAAGMLVDLDGDDNYNAYDLCQGAGSANGLGLLADVRGKDVYIVRSDKNTQGYGNPRRDYGSIGIFLDLGGEDGYSGGRGADSTWWTYSKWGVGIDK
jgi:hypothetical protein